MDFDIIWPSRRPIAGVGARAIVARVIFQWAGPGLSGSVKHATYDQGYIH
jgi:hypothetical protein